MFRVIAAAAPLAGRVAFSAAAAPRVFATPLARKVAKESGIDLLALAGRGSGPGGRILRGDLAGVAASAASKTTAPAPVAVAQPKAAVVAPTPAAAPAPAAVPATVFGDFTDLTTSGLSRSIAARLAHSKQTVPHYTLTADINLDSLLSLRARLNASQAEDAKLSVNDFFIKASAIAMRKVPEVNSSWLGDVIRTYDYVDVCVSVGSPDGAVAPVVRDAHAKGLGAISSSVRSLSQSAQAGTLTPADVNGGTFTIVNLGAFGVRQFAAIISPPQAAVLAVGTVSKRVIPSAAPTAEVPYALATQVSVTLSCDHRVVDGAVGAQWLATFKELLQNPESMLI